MGGVYGRQANRYSPDNIRKVSVSLKYSQTNTPFTPHPIDYSSIGLQLVDAIHPDIKKGSMLSIDLWLGEDMVCHHLDGQVIWIREENDRMYYGVEFFEEQNDMK